MFLTFKIIDLIVLSKSFAGWKFVTFNSDMTVCYYLTVEVYKLAKAQTKFFH